jgi:4,5-dihydroxyphthalate decarboxylase
MADVKITFACGPYDRMEALKSGAVRPEGIDLQFVSIRSPRQIFDKMGGRNAEFDASEFSASEYISQFDRGDCQFVALPVFPSICFRHSFIYHNRRKGIRKPKDLEGKRIGTPLYTQTAAVWIRGILTHEYGVDFSKVTWVQGAMEKAGTHGTPSAPDLLKPVKIERAPADKSVSDLLESGAIDATLGSRGPEPLSAYPSVARLFPDYRAVERDYYRRTRICPIMHTVVLKKTIYEKNPWVAESLYKAFEESRRRALEDMKYPGALRFMLPWLGDDLDEIDEVFGGDPWPYGLEAQRPTMEALVQYLAEQNFIKAKMPLEKLFVKVS